MTTTSTPEIMQNAEFVTIMLPSDIARYNRRMRMAKLCAGGAATSFAIAIVATVVDRRNNPQN